MKGLLLKEFYSLKSYVRTYVLFIVLFGAITAVTGQASFFGAMVGVMVFSLPISSFTIDESCNWNRMALTMPLSRNAIIGAKYLLCIAFSAGALLLSLVVTLLSTMLHPQGDPLSLLLGGASTLLVMSLVNAILLPFIVKLGADKARMVMMIGFGLIFSLIMGVVLLIDKQSPAQGAQQLSDTVVLLIVMAVAVVLTVIGYLISYKISCGIYAKKQF